MNFFHKHKIAKILIGVPVSIVLLLILIFSVLTIIPLFEGIDRSPVPGTDSWMKDLPDDMLISDVMLPGTHDSAAKYVSLPFFSRCQALDIAGQLEAGYRFLDIRLNAKEDGSMFLMHGFTYCRNGLMPWSGRLELGTVLAQCYSFLKAHPSEFIIFSAKQERTDVSLDLFEYILKSFVDASPEYWLLTDSIVSVAEARGKLVLMRRYKDTLGLGSDSGISFFWSDQNNRQNTDLAETLHDNGSYTLMVQDRYKYDSEDKRNAFLNALASANEALSGSNIFINYLSTNGNTLYGHPYKYARRLNSWFISDDDIVPAGWTIVDFGTPKIAEKIYRENFDQ